MTGAEMRTNAIYPPHASKRLHGSRSIFSSAPRHSATFRLCIKVTICRLLHHPGHATHAAHTSHTSHWGRRALLLSIDDAALAGGEQAGDTRGIDQGGSDNLKRVEDTGRDHVAVLRGLGVVTPVELLLDGELLGEKLADDNGTFLAGVVDDGSGRTTDRVADDGDTELLVKVLGLDGLELSRGFLRRGSA
jgi:hypothetical protein